ncbi:MAG: hypothetical protein R3Y64_10175 [Peptostreptococcaceae bacterium]
MKKQILALSLTSLMLTGCENNVVSFEPFNVNFEFFLQRDTSDIIYEDDIDFTPIEITDNSLDSQTVLDIVGILELLFYQITDRDFYFSNFTDNDKFFNDIKIYFDDDRIDELMEDNAIKDAINNIFSKEHSDFKEIKVVSINRIEDRYECLVEVVSTSDYSEFGCEEVLITLNNRLQIIDTSTYSSLSLKTNTSNEISENSLLGDNQNRFYSNLATLRAELSDINLYKKIENEDKNALSLLDNFIMSINVSDKSNLKELFIDARGEFSNMNLKSITVSDLGHMAETTYRYKVGRNYYDFVFSRITNEITKVLLVD